LAIEDLHELDQEFGKDFATFFEDLRKFSHQKLQELSAKKKHEPRLLDS
jgi:hypothetical protein